MVKKYHVEYLKKKSLEIEDEDTEKEIEDNNIITIKNDGVENDNKETKSIYN